MINAILFDFDGLIVDTESPEYETWLETYQEHGCDLTIETWANCIGKGKDFNAFDPFADLELKYGQPIDRERIAAARRPRYLARLERNKALPGVEKTIFEATKLGLKLGVASSSSREWVEGNLTRLGLVSFFDQIKTADDVTQTKPNPEVYLALLKALDVQPDEAIALEDSHFGTMAAKAAGLFCVSIPTRLTAHLPYDHTDLRLASMDELNLEALIRQVEAKAASEG